MKLAITIWDNRISPVFDAATQFLLVELSEGSFRPGGVVAIEDDPFTALFLLQEEQGVEFLLCGALCQRGEKQIRALGLGVLPFLTGEVEVILQDLVAGGDLENFALPGCRRHCCCKRKQKTKGFFWKNHETDMGGGKDERQSNER